MVSAWGRHPDWYLNLKAGPAIEVRISSQVWRRPDHRFLDTAATAEMLRFYRQAHPKALKRLASILGLPPDPQTTDLLAVHALVFTPSSPTTPDEGRRSTVLAMDQ